jgi:hypothetical protein
MILQNNKVLEDLLALRENGFPKGDDLKFGGFPLRFIRGGCTDITGYPFYGKSLVLKEILIGLSKRHNWKHFIYMPDDGSDTEVMSNLLHKITGKSFNRDDSNFISKDEIVKSFMQLTDNFKFVDTTQNYSPQELWIKAKESGCNSVAIDSWNYLNHPEDPTRPNYLRQVLSERNKFMQANKMHSFIIIHPKNPDPLKVKDGTVNKPTVYDLMGGSEWNNNGRNIIVVHKDNKQNFSPYQIYCDKVKPKNCGQIDYIDLFINWDTQQFFKNTSNGRQYGYEQ